MDKVKNSYYYFQGVLTKEVCQKIINLGETQIQNIKNSGGTNGDAGLW